MVASASLNATNLQSDEFIASSCQVRFETALKNHFAPLFRFPILCTSPGRVCSLLDCQNAFSRETRLHYPQHQVTHEMFIIPRLPMSRQCKFSTLKAAFMGLITPEIISSNLAIPELLTKCLPLYPGKSLLPPPH